MLAFLEWVYLFSLLFLSSRGTTRSVAIYARSQTPVMLTEVDFVLYSSSLFFSRSCSSMKRRKDWMSNIYRTSCQFFTLSSFSRSLILISWNYSAVILVGLLRLGLRRLQKKHYLSVMIRFWSQIFSSYSVSRSLRTLSSSSCICLVIMKPMKFYEREFMNCLTVSSSLCV